MSDLIPLWAHGDPSAALDLDPVRTVAGASVRFAQAVLEGAPYLLGGVALAGLLRGVIGGAAVRRRLGAQSPAGVAWASVAGLILPLGALGALPVARRLLATGVPRGTTLAFLLSAAVLDPLSLLFGLSLMGPLAVMGCVAASLAWALGCGLLVNRLAPAGQRADEESVERTPTGAVGRLVRALSTMAEEMSGPSLRDLMLAAAGAGLLGAFLPPGLPQDLASPSRPAASLVASAVAAVASETPVEAMRQAGVLLRDGYSHRVAFVILAFGSGVNLAVLVWLRRGLGLRVFPLAGVLGIGLVSFSLLGWGFDRGGRAASADQAFHTHAFDEVGRPNLAGQGVWQAGADAWSILARGGAHRLPALGLIAAVATIGLLARRPRIRAALERWGSSLDTPRPVRHAWERPLSTRWLAALGIVASIPAIAALVLTHYPAPAVLFDEMVPAHTEVQLAVRLGKAEEALPWIDRWEDLARKLGPAAILRRGSIDATARRRLDGLIDDIEALRGFLEDGRIEEARTLLGPVSRAQQECRRAFEAPG